MSRVPPGLLYLTIYNPNIKPSGPSVGDDEDAEEQAQILFYTARERAVSRDRILRQVGLAKALVNFTGMFSSSDVCENTHSQSRRMIMVSPEPNFWIHACLELAKSPRPPPSKAKGRGTGKSTAPQPIVYDYHDGSIHDVALRAKLLRGYEEFKLTHGSFASILTSLGQQALELQLERFFTVWAWKWDLDEDMNFGDHLGAPMHPSHRLQAPLLETFSGEHVGPLATFILIPPYVVPSKQLTRYRHPGVLTSHILSRIPPPPTPTPQEPQINIQSTDPEKRTQDLPIVAPSAVKSLNQTIRAAGPLFKMDMPDLKWMWSGLTFPKPSSAKPTAPPTPAILPGGQPSPLAAEAQSPDPKVPDTTLVVPKREVEVDAESLQEAITSDSWASKLPSPGEPESVPLPPSPVVDATEEPQERTADNAPEEVTPRLAHDDSLAQRIEQQAAESSSQATEAPPEEQVPPVPIPEFLSTSVHLAQGDDPLHTTRHRVYHATQGQYTFAFIAAESETPDLTSIAEQLPALFSDMESTLNQDTSGPDDIATPVAKLLEPQTKHVISSGGFTSSSRPELVSKSDHLYNGRQMLQSGFDIHEVFSRGQNPQHWHISRRGLGQNGEDVQGEVFMEVARKESTLTDVDNELAGIVRRFLE